MRGQHLWGGFFLEVSAQTPPGVAGLTVKLAVFRAKLLVLPKYIL
jgi:hypothetical protein